MWKNETLNVTQDIHICYENNSYKLQSSNLQEKGLKYKVYRP